MKKILILISILISMTGGTVFYLQNKQEEKPKLEQVNVSEKITEEKVAEESKSKENKVAESEKIPEQKVVEVKETKKEVKSDRKPENNNVSSASKNEVKQEKKQNNSVSKEVPKETPKETPKPKENSNTTPSQKPSSQPQNGGATTKFYESITGGKKEFASESEASASGAEIKSKELDYVLDYNEQHPEAPIKPDINYYRVYPSVIDENGKYWYYLHFFCASGEGNDAKLKSMY